MLCIKKKVDIIYDRFSRLGAVGSLALLAVARVAVKNLIKFTRTRIYFVERPFLGRRRT